MMQPHERNDAIATDAYAAEAGAIYRLAERRVRRGHAFSRLGLLGVPAFLVIGAIFVLSRGTPTSVETYPVSEPDAVSQSGSNSPRPALTTVSPLSGLTSHFTVWDGREYLVAGLNSMTDGQFEMAAFEPSAGKWRSLPSIPITAYERISDLAHPAGGAILHAWTGDNLVVFSATTASVYSTSSESWSVFESPLGTRLNWLATKAVWTGSEVMVWGYEYGAHDSSAVSVLFDPETGEWRTVSAGPLDYRVWPVVQAVDGKVVVWGGSDSTIRGPGSGAVFDPVVGGWSMIPNGPLSERHQAASIGRNQKLHIFGGSPGLPGEPLIDGATLDMDSMEWTSLPELPYEVSDRSSVVVDDGEDGALVLTGGRPDAPLATASSFTLRKDRWELAELTAAGAFTWCAFSGDGAPGVSVLLFGGYRPCEGGDDGTAAPLSEALMLALE